MKARLIGGVAVLALAGCGGSVVPEITDVRVAEPTGPHAALYFTATSSGPSDKLVAAATDVAQAVELHRSMIDDQGVAGMERLDEFGLPAGGRLVLEPGDYHLMLVDVDRLEVGDTIEVTLTWEKAGNTPVTADVVSPAHTLHEEP